jgi:hypothetical protein
MKVVYVAGPFRGKTAWEVCQNVNRAEELSFKVAEAGAMPLCPHTNTRNFDGTKDGQFWLDGTMELMRRCDAMIMTEDWTRSSGARGEFAEMTKLGKPIFYSIDELEKWLEPPF